MLETIAESLHLERAALLTKTADGQRYVPLATVGTRPPVGMAVGSAPPDGPWSAILPVPPEEGAQGLLLLGAAGGKPLGAAAQQRAASLAVGLGRMCGHRALQADLARSRDLLARTDRLSGLGTLAAGVAHEIRNPLVSVRTFLQLLPERADDLHFRTEFRELALAEIERICELINDLLGFARPHVADRTAVDLNDLLDQTLRLLAPDLRRQVVAVVRTQDLALASIDAAEGQVRQVLINLIANGVEACGGPGELFVETRQVDEDGRAWAVVTVADTGPGIPESDVPQLFDPFFTTKPNGSGLGLYIVRQIISEHGGQIRIEPREGGGARFSIYFPLPAERRDGRS